MLCSRDSWDVLTGTKRKREEGCTLSCERKVRISKKKENFVADWLIAKKKSEARRNFRKRILFYSFWPHHFLLNSYKPTSANLQYIPEIHCRNVQKLVYWSPETMTSSCFSVLVTVGEEEGRTWPPNFPLNLFFFWLFISLCNFFPPFLLLY